MGSARLTGRSPEISGLAALRRQGYGLFAAKLWFKSQAPCLAAGDQGHVYAGLKDGIPRRITESASFD
jgi:hypothetical protein